MELHKDCALLIKLFIFLDGDVLFNVKNNVSTIVFPVTYILFESLFSFKRLLAAQSVGQKYKLLISSIVNLLNSSGNGYFNLCVLSPAYT